MCKSVVIDTNIFINFITEEKDYKENLSIVSQIMLKRIRIVLDHNSIIYNEYNKNILKNLEKTGAQLLKKLFSKNRFSNNSIFHCVEPISTDFILLLKKEGFHKKDLIFVQVSPKSDMKIIISEDGCSFHDSKFKAKIKKNLNVNVLNSCEFFKIIPI